MRFSKKEWNDLVTAFERWLKVYPVPEAKLDVKIDGKIIHYTPVQLVERLRKRTQWSLKLARHVKQKALKTGFATIPEYLDAKKKEWNSFSKKEHQKHIQELQKTK